MILVQKGIYESQYNDKYDEVVLFLKKDKPTTCDISGLQVEYHVVTVRINDDNIDEAVTGSDEDKEALVAFELKGKPNTGGMSDERFLWHIARQDKCYYDIFKDKPEFTTTGWKVRCDRCGDSARDFFCLDMAINNAKAPSCKHHVRQRIHRVVTHKVMLPEAKETVEDTVYGTVQVHEGKTYLYRVKSGDRVLSSVSGEGEIISIIEDGNETVMRILWDYPMYQTGFGQVYVFGTTITNLNGKPIYQVV